MGMKIIKTIFFLFILVILLPNTVSAEAAIGPPIGEIGFVFSSDTVLPNEDVTVTIKWWITNESYTYYFGPFNIHIELRDSDETEIVAWTDHVTIGKFNYPATELKPYTYDHTRNAPFEVGTYTLDVQIVANGLEREVGKSDNEHRLLVGSDEESLTTIPEFSTLAIPMAIAILTGLFFLNRYKRREE
ncbi:MAG: hypothetical protein KAT65_03785 [Methanophagales archaeon]|nr:hypothetical protein [Methanophagales archaeon]